MTDLMEIPAPSVETVSVDGFIIDVETGEVLACPLFDDAFTVDTIQAAERVLSKMQEVDTEISSLEHLLRVRADALKERIERKRKFAVYLENRFKPLLERFASRQLEGQKGRTLRTDFGCLSFRQSGGGIAVIPGEESGAITWARRYCPEAVKVTTSILVTPLKPLKMKLPDTLFEIKPVVDTFTINTGIGGAK